MNLNLIEKLYYESLVKISFTDKYKKVFLGHSDYNQRLSKMSKKDILNSFKKKGYSLRVSSPGQYYIYEEKIESITLRLMFQISGGMTTEYLQILDKNGTRFEIMNDNLAFAYRYMIGNMDAEVNAPIFKDYEELAEIIGDFMEIYKDFKSEFIQGLKIVGE
jgi:hypothetical protein